MPLSKKTKLKKANTVSISFGHYIPYLNVTNVIEFLGKQNVQIVYD